MKNLSKKNVYLLVSGKPERLSMLSELIDRHNSNSIVYTATSGNHGILKSRNAHIDIVIVDSAEFTMDAYRMVDGILHENINPNQAFILVGPPPAEDRYVDQLVTKKLYFIDEELNDKEFAQTLARALNYTTQDEQATFHLRYLATGDTLMKKGEKAEFVYILKSGLLQAYNIVDGQKVILGNVETGEFVGEMAYINNEPRNASIEALTDSQLIEVPIELVDKILYQRPAWSKALLATLSKRLKNANLAVSKK